MAQTPAAPEQGFVGSTVCKACHPDVALQFYRNPHNKSIVAASTLPKEKIGCEGCHGPGKKHVAAGGGKATIKAYSQLAPQQIFDSCLGCNSKDVGRSNNRTSSHTKAAAACTARHSIHKSDSTHGMPSKQPNDA